MYPAHILKHGINVSQFLYVQPSSVVKYHFLVCVKQALAYSTVTADTGGLLCEAGTFHGKLQRPQSHKQLRHCPYCHLVVTFSLHWVQMNGKTGRTEDTSTAPVDVT